jgi:hypothetical protein
MMTNVLGWPDLEGGDEKCCSYHVVNEKGYEKCSGNQVVWRRNDENVQVTPCLG